MIHASDHFIKSKLIALEFGIRMRDTVNSEDGYTLKAFYFYRCESYAVYIVDS